MAGGFIFQKTNLVSIAQSNADKSLIIDPNYAYQVPFSFTDWTDIKIGMFVSYVKSGAGVDSNSNAINGDVGVDGGLYSAGGISLDGFNYVGIMKTGVASDDPSLPLTTENSGFLGMQADKVYILDSTAAYYNKFVHSSEGTNTQGDSRLIATNGTTLLESKEFQEGHGNFGVLAVAESDSVNSSTSVPNTTKGSPEKNEFFADYWGMRFRVHNKNTPNQKINFQATINGSSNSHHQHNQGNAISDVSMTALKSFINGIGEYTPSNVHGNTSIGGFAWNDGSNAYALPDSLFFYNAFQDLRPRIHAWAIKKIS